MSSGPNLLAALAWFVAIVAAIPAALWLLRRSPMGSRMAQAAQAPMRSVAQLALGAQQKLVTVEVGQGEERRWLVLGVAPGGVSLVYTLTPQAEAAPAATPGNAAEGFQQLLSRLRNHRSGNGGL